MSTLEVLTHLNFPFEREKSSQNNFPLRSENYAKSEKLCLPSKQASNELKSHCYVHCLFAYICSMVIKKRQEGVEER